MAEDRERLKAEALSRAIDIINKHGPRSQEIADYTHHNKELYGEEFEELVATAIWIKEHIEEMTDG